MGKSKNLWSGPLLAALGVWAALLLPVQAGPLSFAKAQILATLPWAEGPRPGAPSGGPEWLVVDPQGRYYLESDRTFDVFGPQGHYLRSLSPFDKTKNFFGFAAMEPLPEGGILLLARLETSLEQWGKDNFEMQAKPGARLLALTAEGQVLQDRELADPLQPHSDYVEEKGLLYSVHEDGTFTVLGPVSTPQKPDPDFGNYAALAFNLPRWRSHLKELPVFRSRSRSYHDVHGLVHQDKGALDYLMGRRFVEGKGPVAFRGGRIYFRVVLDESGGFVNSVFVEDPRRKSYGLVDLIPEDPDLNCPHGQALFVDRQGDLFEGVARKDGYRIYKWKALF